MSANYTELLAEVEDWAKRPDLTAQIPSFILYAEKRLNRDLRLRQMETSLDVTIDAQTEALPSDFLEVRRFYIEGSPKTILSYLEPHVFWGAHTGSESGKPTAYTIEGGNFVFGKSPDTTYTGKLQYYAEIPALVSNSTNWLLTQAPDLYVYASLVALAHYTRDNEYLATVAGLYDEAVKALKNDGRFGGVNRYVPKVSP